MKKRLDVLLVERGLAETRRKAQALVMEGRVLVDRGPVRKAGAQVPETAAVEVTGEEVPYVSRGGLKLQAAAQEFGIDFSDKVAMDVGASTGGFTDYMLQAGARRVYAVDVGYGQLHWKLRQDPRVVLVERSNIRYLERDRIGEPVDAATVDVSFISLRLVVPRVMEFLKPGGEVVALVKPQFEVGKGEVGKGGIVRDEEKRRAAVEAVRSSLEAAGLRVRGVMESPLRGQKGNVEYLLYGVKED
jgi:23S rRNA (cytidine1920-2'-O)/16S rRNA (cytidine1409-2'-O)-methyltransferase